MPRTHRRLLLLVNGQRNISELTRILARPPEETQALLNDLERAGLIRQ
jgi:DNA-binding IclR family transcriptional regulator